MKIGYINFKWIEDRPCKTQVKEIYGCHLPNTTLGLPLHLEKVEAVKKQLSSIHLEVLSFMSKIDKLSVYWVLYCLNESPNI